MEHYIYVTNSVFVRIFRVLGQKFDKYIVFDYNTRIVKYRRYIMENYSVNKTTKFLILTALAIAATLSLGFLMYQSSLNTVTLQLDNETITVVSSAKTVEELLMEEFITLNKDTYMNVDLNQTIEEQMNIIIKNPSLYTISYAATDFEIKSFEDTVGDILMEVGIELGEKDFTYPSLDEKVHSGDSIELFRVKEELETIEEPISFERVVNKNNQMDLGMSKVVQKGSDGTKVSYYNKRYVNGELVSSELVKEEITKDPISEITEKGTKALIVTSRGDTSYRKAIVMTATAYDLSFESTGKRPGDRYYGLTASGTKARPGVVAVDPRVIPLGTKLYVQSLDGSKDYGFAIAEDKGGAIKGNKIDLFFETATQVSNFGRRKVKVYILD